MSYSADFFSNLYINYYYGSFITCTSWWKDTNVTSPFSKIYYITDGECRITIEGTEFSGRPGDLFLIPAGRRHSYGLGPSGDMKKYWFHFSMESGGGSVFDRLELPYKIEAGRDRRLISRFRSILRGADDETLAGSLSLKADIAALVAEYLRRAEVRPAGGSGKGDPLEAVMEHIRKNMSRPISIKELAGVAHLHPNYFIRYFRERTGMTPAKYISRRRMERAKSLLENTSASVGEIMEQVGLDDLSHFSKQFKSYSGYSPAQFRKTYGV